MSTLEQPNFRSLNRNVKVRLGIAFLERFIGSMVTPIVTIYLATTLSAQAAAVLMFSAAVLGVISSLYFGSVADRHGRRPVLLQGSAGMVIAFGGMSFGASSSISSWGVVFGFYVVQMMAISAMLPAHEAMLIDISTPAERRLVYSISYWSVNVALASGALLGGILYSHLAPMFFGYCLIAAAGLVATWIFIRETKPRAGQFPPRSARLTSYSRVLRDSSFRRLTLAKVLLLGIEFQLAGYIAVRLARDFREGSLLPWSTSGIHLDGVALVGILRAENTLLVVAVTLFAASFLQRSSNIRRILIGGVLFTAGYATLAIGLNPLLLILAMLIASVGEIVYVPALQSVVADFVPPGHRSEYMAVFGLSSHGGQMIAAICLGVGAMVADATIPVVVLVSGTIALSLIITVIKGIPPEDPVDTKGAGGFGE